MGQSKARVAAQRGWLVPWSERGARAGSPQATRGDGSLPGISSASPAALAPGGGHVSFWPVANCNLFDGESRLLQRLGWHRPLPDRGAYSPTAASKIHHP